MRSAFLATALFTLPALADEPARFVVLKPTATLHASPDAPGWHFYESMKGATAAEADGELHAMRLIEDRGDWLLVENIPGNPLNDHCQSSLWSLDAMRLRFWVKRSNLGLATIKPVTMQYKDGTSVSLTQGLGATPKKGNSLVTLGVMQLELAIPKESLGTTYELPELFEETEETDQVLVGGGSPNLVFDNKNVVRSTAHAPLVKSVQKKEAKGKEWLVTLRDSCGELVVRAPKKAVKADDGKEPVAMIGGNLNGLNTSSPMVRGGSTIYWPKGTEAGAVGETPITVQRVTRLEPDRWCTDYDLIQWRNSRKKAPADQVMKLCFDEKSVIGAE